MTALLDCIERLDLIDDHAKAPPSLIKSFSLFSLFRGRSAKGVDGAATALSSSSSHLGAASSSERVSAAVASYNSRIRALKAAAPGASEEHLAEALGRAVADCLDIVSLSLQMPSSEEATVSRSSCQIALRSALEIRTELAALPRAASDAVLDFDRDVLSASFAPTSRHAHLAHLFARAREAILHLGHAVRATATKGRSLPPGSFVYYTAQPPEHDVLWLMDLLHLFSQRVAAIDNLGYLEEEKPAAAPMSKRAKSKPLSARRQAALAKSQAAARRVKSLRTAMEADILRCELALSMANVSMETVKRRASAREFASTATEEAPLQDDPDVTTDPDDDDLEVVRSNAVRDKTEIDSAAEPARSESSDVEWESVAEQALLDCLVSATGCLRDGHSDALVADVTLYDWVPPAVPSSKRRENSDQRESRSADQDSEPDDDDASSEAFTDSSDDSDDDRSHACPLRTLFRLYDRFEEQRLAVWLTLPTSTRGKMGWFLRGSDGKVGSAWDALGHRLLATMDADDLLAYGLSGDKLDKWTQAENRSVNKRRKRGRMTI